MVFLLIILSTTRPKMATRLLSSFLMVSSVHLFFHCHSFISFYLSVNIRCGGQMLIISNPIHIINFMIVFRFINKFSFVVILLGLLSLLDISKKSFLILRLTCLHILRRYSTFRLQFHSKLFIFFMLYSGLLCSVWFWAVALSVRIWVYWLTREVLFMIIWTHGFLLLRLHFRHLNNFSKYDLILVIYPHRWNLITFNVISIASLGFLCLLLIIILYLWRVYLYGWLLLFSYLAHFLQLLLHQVQTRFALMLALFALLVLLLLNLLMTVILF